MGFRERLERGNEFGYELAEWLKDRPGVHLVALNGSEYTHPEFVDALRHLNTPAALFVRYAPDGVYLAGEQVVHFDAKVGRTIEKNAYNVYMAHKRAGCRVILFVRHDGKTYWQWIENVRFRDSWEIASQFPPSKRFAIDSEGWFIPRRSNTSHVRKDMSKTPYKYLDFNSFHEISLSRRVA